MALLTAAEFKASLEGKKLDLTSVTDAEIQLVLDDAAAELQLHLDYDVVYGGTSLTLIGGGTSRLYLPQRAQTVTAVTVDGTAITGFSLSNDGWALDTTGIFTSGAEVEITGTFGFVSPEPAYLLARKVVRRWTARVLSTLAPKAAFPSPPGAYITSYSTEGASFTYYTPGEDAEIDNVLSFLAKPFGAASSKGFTSIPVTTIH